MSLDRSPHAVDAGEVSMEVLTGLPGQAIPIVRSACEAALAAPGRSCRLVEAFYRVRRIFLSLLFYLSLYPSVSSSIHLSLYLSIYLSIYLSLYLSISLSIHLSISLSISLFICLFFYLSIYLSIYLSLLLSIYLSVCLSICLSVASGRPRCIAFQLKFCSCPTFPWRLVAFTHYTQSTH